MGVDKTLPPAERLLQAADLFYAEGIHSVGVNRIIEAAGVAQMGLWRAFGSKDGLVEAWLQRRDEALLAEMVAVAEDAGQPPRDRILALFDVAIGRCRLPEFRGCLLIKAAAEAHSPEEPAARLAAAHKQAVRHLMIGLAEAAGVPAPERLATQLSIVMEGGFISAATQGDPEFAVEAKVAAEVLLDAALGRSRRRKSPGG